MQPTDRCPVATTLELIGGKYKALILWHLSQNTLRYGELRHAIPTATPKMLTQQLRELEAHGLISREVFPVVPPKVVYSMTPQGKSLMPVLTAMRDWGVAYLASQDLSSTCFMLNNTFSHQQPEGE